MFAYTPSGRAVCRRRCAIFLVALNYLKQSSATAQPDRHILTREDRGVLALNAKASLEQLPPIEEEPPHTFVREATTDTRLRTDFTAAAAVIRKSLDAACRALGKLEARIDSSQGIDAAEFSVYEDALVAWRANHPGEQPACRVKQLNDGLCKDAALFADMLWSTEGGSVWDSRIRELMLHEMNTTECQSFTKTPAPYFWNPAIPSAAAATAATPSIHEFSSSTEKTLPEGDLSDLEELVRDPDYDALYARAGHLAAAFGPPEGRWQLRPEGRFRMERVQHLHDLRVLRKAVPSMDIAGLRQILTFGGGSGDSVAMLFDLGYEGTHLVYDHPAMLLVQRLWLRYSGVPVVLGEDMLASPGTVKKKIVLESSLGQKIFSHVDSAKDNDSLFRSTTYFTQEDVTSFEKIRPVIKNFGLIQFAFQPKRNAVDTSEYLHRFVDEDLSQTHNVLTWQAKKRHGNGGNGEVFHFLAVLKNRGPVACLKELNCMPSTLHPTLGRRGNVKMEEVPVKSQAGRAIIWGMVVALLLLVSDA